MKTVGTLKANIDAGEGDIDFGDIFEGQSNLWKVDVLGDWLCDIQEAYDKQKADFLDEMEFIRKAANNE